MEKFKYIISTLSKISYYAFHIKSKHCDHFLVLNQKDDLLSWYKSDRLEPFIIETKAEIVRLDKPDIMSIKYQPITNFRRGIEPFFYVLASPQSNMVRPFFLILVLAIAGFFGWAEFKDQSISIMGFMKWFDSSLVIISNLFGIVFCVLGFEAIIKGSKGITHSYLEKHNLFDSLAVQALKIGVLSAIILPGVMSLIALKLL